jgi:hypothetical protein
MAQKTEKGGSWSKRIMVQGQPGNKLVRPYLKNKPDMLVHGRGPSYSGGGGRRTVVQHQPGQKQRPYLKNKVKVKGLGVWLKR